ncbi:MAG: membrane dipeptidase [Gammaproteobacteria bacterium]|jgi:membrane dipeptidase
MGHDLATLAQKLYDDAFVWDAHAGFEAWPTTDLTQLGLWKNAGVDFLSVNVGYDLQTLADTIRALAYFRRWFDASEDFQVVTSVAQARGARDAGKMAVAFDLEGMNPLAKSLDVLHLLHELGVRQMLFAYNRNSDAGGGCHDDDRGLTQFGRDAVREMNDLGILIDCSHCGYRTTMEAMELSRAPVIFSHSNPRGLHDHERNIVDTQAVACAVNGGVIGVNGISNFLGDAQCSSAAVADHVDYLLDLLGEAHVGIGLDYFFNDNTGAGGFNDVVTANAQYWPRDQYPGGPLRCAMPTQLLELTEIMLQRGREERVVRGVLGENFARVAAEVWGG